MDSSAKLAKIQELARLYNDQLLANSSVRDKISAQGGCILLSKHYAQSRYIFATINPGPYREKPSNNREVVTGTDSFCVSCQEKPPWDHDHSFWCNYKTKFEPLVPDLAHLAEEATIVFCSPWRSQDTKELASYNRMTGGKIYDFSGKLFRTILDDHRMLEPPGDVVIFAAGVAALEFLGSRQFLDFSKESWKKGNGSSRWVYQWHTVRVGNRRTTIFQLPHFSWAKNKERLKSCAEWLTEALRQEKKH